MKSELKLLLQAQAIDAQNQELFAIETTTGIVHLADKAATHAHSTAPADADTVLHNLPDWLPPVLNSNQYQWLFCNSCFNIKHLDAPWVFSHRLVVADARIDALQLALTSPGANLPVIVGRAQKMIQTRELLTTDTSIYSTELICLGQEKHKQLESLVHHSLTDERIIDLPRSLRQRLCNYLKYVWEEPAFTSLANTLQMTKSEIYNYLSEVPTKPLNVWLRLPIEADDTAIFALAHWPKQPRLHIQGKEVFVIKAGLDAAIGCCGIDKLNIIAADDNCTEQEVHMLAKMSKPIPGALKALRAATI